MLQETICPGIIGGKLDFPRSASFAAVKLAVWWEEEYVAAYRKPSGWSFVISVISAKIHLLQDCFKESSKKIATIATLPEHAAVLYDPQILQNL